MKKIIATLAIASSIATTAEAAVIYNSADAAFTGATVETFETYGTGDFATINTADAAIVGIGSPMTLTTTWTPQYGVSGINLQNSSTTPQSFEITFNNTVDAFGIWGGAYDSGWTWDLYDLNDNLLATEAVNISCCNAKFAGVAMSGIKSVILKGFGDWVIFDNMTYKTSDLSPVPVPAAVWLFGTALMGFAGFARKKRSQA